MPNIPDIKEIIMPWGAFKGTYIHACPSSYLKWLAEGCDWDDTICNAADEEWQHRERNNEHRE